MQVHTLELSTLPAQWFEGIVGSFTRVWLRYLHESHDGRLKQDSSSEKESNKSDQKQGNLEKQRQACHMLLLL